MNIVELKKLKQEETSTSRQLEALWWEVNGDWDTAHQIVQVMNDKLSCWIHAYLHRKEGDIANSRYWYSHTDVDYRQEVTFDDEVQEILDYMEA